MDYIIARAERAGSHFFEKSTMHFFNSRLLPATLTQIGPDGDDFRFVTSELMPGDARRTYTVRSVHFFRVADNNGTPRERVEFDTVGEFRQHNSSQQARKHIRDGL